VTQSGTAKLCLGLCAVGDSRTEIEYAERQSWMSRSGTDMPTAVKLILVFCACAGRHGDVIVVATSASGFVNPNTVGAASATGKAITVHGDIMIGGLFPIHEIGSGDQVRNDH